MTPATLKILWQLARGGRGDTAEGRLTDFYAPQAASYDRFREGLLHGRQRLIDAIDPGPGARIADFGGGTARNLEFYGARLADFAQVDVVDLCPPLLAVAERRRTAHGWRNVALHHADVTRFEPVAPYHAITFSYSLSMIPEWRRALDHAIACLAPGGVIGVVDFYVSQARPQPGRRRHNACTRRFWPWWFRRDGVHLRADLLPTLDDRLELELLHEGRGRLPLTPFTVPHCVVVGRPCRSR